MFTVISYKCIAQTYSLFRYQRILSTPMAGILATNTKWVAWTKICGFKTNAAWETWPCKVFRFFPCSRMVIWISFNLKVIPKGISSSAWPKLAEAYPGFSHPLKLNKYTFKQFEFGFIAPSKLLPIFVCPRFVNLRKFLSDFLIIFPSWKVFLQRYGHINPAASRRHLMVFLLTVSPIFCGLLIG